MTDRISGAEAARRAGVSYRRVDYWCRAGYLGPAQALQPGSGALREFTERDVDALRALGLVMRLRDSHASHDNFVAFAGHVRDHGLVGTFELLPGVTVDVERLIEAGNEKEGTSPCVPASDGSPPVSAPSP